MTDDTASLQNGQGMLVKRGDKPIAIYKKPDGSVVEMSAVCTHAGCTVGWNDAEKTWDCPCHGSRYDAEGNVIHPPATDPLPRVSE